MKKIIFLAVISIVMLTMNSCGDYKQSKYVTIGTNETAFVIPMEQGTKEDQKKFKSIDYLEANKAPTKRVYIDQIKISTGRMYWDYKWIPTDSVVVVHRSPVTREWTKTSDGGTSSSNQVLNVESAESIGFDVPVNTTASVLEEDAATFLYWYGGKDIETVMDNNVRPYILDVLTTEFGKRSLDLCQSQRMTVYDSMKVKTVRFFKKFGLTVINIGAAGEFSYTNPKIQESINEKFVSEMKITTSANEKLSANNFAAAAETIKKQKELDADVEVKKAWAKYLTSEKVVWPSTLVIGKDGSMQDAFLAKSINGK